MITHVELIQRLLLGAFLGSIIGFEREWQNRVAGLRTHMLVCVGATLVMLVSQFGFDDALRHGNVVLDPSRVAAQVVSGIGFLGAGAILLRGDMVRGLNTAASLWSVAGIGLAVGGGLYVAAVGATVIILIILAGIKPLETRWLFTREQPVIELLAQHDSVGIDRIESLLGPGPVRLEHFSVQESEPPGLDRLRITLSRAAAWRVDAIQARLRDIPGVRECRRSWPT
ncbi:MAG: MgtC/SapB family protein [Betaproteobacteria bacterium]|nr:MgtC/SapB family protein [Betaproteobacteria bacterium]